MWQQTAKTATRSDFVHRVNGTPLRVPSLWGAVLLSAFKLLRDAFSARQEKKWSMRGAKLLRFYLQ